MGNGVKAGSPESQNALISLFQNLKTEVAGDFSPWQNSSKALGSNSGFLSLWMSTGGTGELATLGECLE